MTELLRYRFFTFLIIFINTEGTANNAPQSESWLQYALSIHRYMMESELRLIENEEEDLKLTKRCGKSSDAQHTKLAYSLSKVNIDPMLKKGRHAKALVSKKVATTFGIDNAGKIDSD